MSVIKATAILAINLQNVLGGEGRTLKTRTQDVLFTRKTRTHGRGSRVFSLTLGLTLTLVLWLDVRIIFKSSN